ncbi:unnamed protein product [Arctogadus glacialis]
MTSVMGQCCLMSEDVQQCAAADILERSGLDTATLTSPSSGFAVNVDLLSVAPCTRFSSREEPGVGAMSCSGHALPPGHDGSLGAIVGRNVPYIQRWIRS